MRSGSILATQPLEQFVGQYPVKEITLDIFPADSETGFTAYDDDGDTYDYEKGVYLRQQIAVQRSGGETQIRIDGATGDYSGPLRTYLLRIHTAASKVAFNTKPMPRAAASAFSFTPAANWVRQNDRFGPVILVRIPAGDKSPASITLR